MKFKLILLVFLFPILSTRAQLNLYQFTVDLNYVEDDKIQVHLIPPKMKAEGAIYRMPKTVPGTYSINNYGRFIEGIKFFDENNKELSYEKLDENSWKVKEGASLGKVTYLVNDTYDTEIKKDYVFEPAGSNIEENKNFVLNTHCVFGYFEGAQNLPYIVNIAKPEGFYGSTSLQAVKSNYRSDTYMVSSYPELVDAPIMYNVPDTSIIKVGGAEILVSVYSPQKVLSSKVVAENVKGILNAAEQYLGGKLPIKKYAFIIYLFDKQSGSGSYGALEHSYSSMYYLPEVNPELIAQSVRDIATHEFFHIITPLNIHSEEIQYFNFSDPKMSKHLWLYEGVTEYTAGQVQVKSNLIDVNTYLNSMIREKIFESEKYKDDLPFTEMSEKSLDEHKDQYENVYQKGALIGMALDIQLRDHSNGKYGLKDLMADLSQSYGKDKPFKDDELFDKIAELTYPEIKDFFNKYVAGSSRLPYEEIFEKVGIKYEKEARYKYFTLGDVGLSYDEEMNTFLVADVSNINSVGREINYKKGDKIVTINKKKLDVETLEGFYEGKNPFKFKEGRKMKVVVKRKVSSGEEKKVKLSAKARKVEYQQKHKLTLIDKPTEKQLQVRNAWLGRK